MKAGQMTDIDGFPINESKGIVTALMQRREYEQEEYDLVLDKEKVRGSLFQHERESDWKLRYVLSSILEIPFYLVLWPRDYPLKKAPKIPKPVVTYKVNQKNDSITLEPEFEGDTKELEAFIFKFRGRSFSFVKPLNVAMTMMECYLASKRGDANPWPGNLDGAVWDEEQKTFKAIIEFKTHNYSQYPISSQYFNQFPGDDRRYKALDIMQNHLGKMSKKPKFVYAIWGTDPSHTEVKLQIIDNLKASNDKLIKRPIFTKTTTKEFTEEVIEYIYG